MPGKSLSHSEKSLIADWDKPGYRFQRLAGLVLTGAGGLRRLRRIAFGCDRPITAICGPGGVGKSTLLDLCGLAYRPKGAPSPDQIGDALERRFVAGPGEAPFRDFLVTWTYRDSGAASVELRGGDGALSADRPERPVLFIGASRLAPARQRLPADPGAALGPAEKLTDKYLALLNDTLGISYKQVSWQNGPEGPLYTCESDVPYSALNMALPEESLIDIFAQIFRVQSGALVLIEDIDAGLSAPVCRQLARNLVKVCYDKSLQIILTARTPEFLDALPRQFRTLVEFDGANHYVSDNVPMRQIMRTLDLPTPPDTVVFCEDDIAEAIILQSVSGELRQRLKIVRAGSKSDLALFAASHHRSGWGHKLLVVWDGDVGEAEVNRWLKALNLTRQEYGALSRTSLPGPQPPERWLLDQLITHNGAALLAQKLREDVRQAQMMLNAVAATAEHHGVFYELARKTRLGQDQVLASVVQAVADLPHQPFAQIAELVGRVVAGEHVATIGPPPEGQP